MIIVANQPLDIDELDKKVLTIPKNSIAKKLENFGISEAFIFSAYIQKWADLLEIGYWDIAVLSISKKKENMLRKIDTAVRKKFGHLLKNPKIIANIIGKHE